MNYNRRHTYYVKRTIEWLATHGFISEKTETQSSAIFGNETRYSKKDLWGSDIICVHPMRPGLHAIQLKTSSAPSTIRLGIRQLTSGYMLSGGIKEQG